MLTIWTHVGGIEEFNIPFEGNYNPYMASGQLKLIGEAFDVDFKDKNHVILAPDESLCLDVTVILGKDYTSKEELMDFISNNRHKNRKDVNNIFQILSTIKHYNSNSKSSFSSK